MKPSNHLISYLKPMMIEITRKKQTELKLQTGTNYSSLSAISFKVTVLNTGSVLICADKVVTEGLFENLSMS